MLTLGACPRLDRYKKPVLNTRMKGAYGKPQGDQHHKQLAILKSMFGPLGIHKNKKGTILSNPR